MRIGVIFTGGTIGSRIEQSGYINTQANAPYQLLEKYEKKYGTQIEFITKEPYRILSENLQAENILQLKDCVKEQIDRGDLSGIIITHGTDTLQYSAALLSYIFAGADIPIILVSSNYVLEDERANGFCNFEYAVRFIEGDYGKGVFVSYQNDKEEPTIHWGTRLQPPIPFSDKVYSVKDLWYGKFSVKSNEFTKSIFDKEPIKEERMFKSTESIKLTDINTEVLRIMPYPGMSYPQLEDKVKAVLHESFHSGTICVENTLKIFVKNAERLSVPVYITGISRKETGYDTVRIYKELGVLPLYDRAVIAQYCKLWLAVSNGMDVQSIMKESFAQENCAR